MSAGEKILKTDGYNFQTIEIPLPVEGLIDIDIRDIFVDNSNNIWFLKNNTVFIYKGERI